MLLYRAEIHLTKSKFVELLQDDADEKQELYPKFRTSGGIITVSLWSSIRWRLVFNLELSKGILEPLLVCWRSRTMYFSVKKLWSPDCKLAPTVLVNICSWRGRRRWPLSMSFAQPSFLLLSGGSRLKGDAGAELVLPPCLPLVTMKIFCVLWLDRKLR